MFDKIINRIPDNYRKEDSNIAKLYKIIASELEYIEKVANKIKETRDIDAAEGKTLDNLGSNVMELRPSEDDELYRQYIKTKITANLSKGDIETINEVASVVLGDNFKGVNETWDNDLYDDIVGLVMDIEPSEEYRFDSGNPLSRVKAGGVKMFFRAMLPEELIIVDESVFSYKSRYELSGEAKSIDRIVNTSIDAIDVVEGCFGEAFDYRLAGKETRTKSTEGEVLLENLNVAEQSFGSRVHYPVSGISVCGGGI